MIKGSYMKHLVISFVGQDRPGLVDTLSNIISRYNANWQASSMHQMSGLFAGVLEVAIENEHVDTLRADIEAITDFDSVIKVATVEAPSSKANIVLELTANDRAGIVQEISSVIHQQGGNLLKLVSVQESAAHSGHTLFKAKASIAINDDLTTPLIDALENLADDLMVDISR